MFLSRDPVESEPPYQYVRGNPINRVDPSGRQGGPPPLDGDPNRLECYQPSENPQDIRPLGCTLPPECYELDIVGNVIFYDSTICPSPPPLPRSLLDSLKYPGGIKGLIDGIIDSYPNRDDGFIFGGDLALTLAPMIGRGLFNPSPENQIELNGDCLPTNSVVGGFEVVLDFKHQEAGYFAYKGSGLNVGTLFGADLVGYLGKTRGFANQPYFGEAVGVAAYGGYFAAGDAFGGFPSGFLVPGPSATGGIIMAAPLKDPSDPSAVTPYKVLNPEGVFATYFAVGGSLGSSYLAAGASGSADIVVTNYSLLPPGRIRVGVPLGGLGADFLSSNLSWWPDAITQQKNIYPNRIFGAKLMETQINMVRNAITGFGLLNDNVGSYMDEAISDIWYFAYRPHVGQ